MASPSSAESGASPRPKRTATRERAAHARLGYATAAELILHLPLRYEDETRLTPLAAAQPGQPVLVEGTVIDAEVQRRPQRQLVARVALDAAPTLPTAHGPGGKEPGNGSDLPGCTLILRLLHFYPNQLGQLRPGTHLRLFGEVRSGFFGAEMVHPRYQIVPPGTPLADRLTPVYPTVAGLSQMRLRREIAQALKTADLSDSLPQDILASLHLPGFATAVETLHHPEPGTSLAAIEAHNHPAWRRLKFDELLAQQLSLRLHARRRQHQPAPPLRDHDGLVEKLLAALPFPLTGAQRRALDEIRRDLGQAHPMHRLLQGDVGSGKTCVAALAALVAVGSGRQAAVMAPTEILADQLAARFAEWLDPLAVRVARLAAGVRGKARQQALTAIASGEAAVAIGTHALFQEDVRFRSLALAIVDEQHRFGVEQRLALRAKGVAANSDAAPIPHLLMMTATPIPRSLAMSYYADLEVSVIDELPPGRSPVVTRVIGDSRRGEVIARLRDYCRDGSQAYWVCPLIEESEKVDLSAALATHAELLAALPELRIGLAHGRMKADDKATVMAAFKAGELDVLVATTVIEVGVDVANAGLMVIEHAERMGLAQLHQLRGRVGRGGRESTCLLLYAAPLSDNARRRLAILRQTTDGFAIARADLDLRGPGEFLGARQSGQAMLRFADPLADAELLDQAAALAQRLIRNHPDVVARHVERWLPRGGDFLRA